MLFSLSAGHEDCLEVLLEFKTFIHEEGNPFTPLHCALLVFPRQQPPPPLQCHNKSLTRSWNFVLRSSRAG